MIRVRVVFPLIVLALAGCATMPAGGCDPSNPNVSLVHKIQCESSGGYRQAIDQREQRVIASEEENAMFRESLAALQAQRAAFGKSVQEQQKARERVVASTRRLLDQINAKGVDDQRLKVQLSLAEKDLAAMQAQPISPNASSADIAERQRKVQELEQMVKRLRDSVLQGF